MSGRSGTISEEGEQSTKGISMEGSSIGVSNFFLLLNNVDRLSLHFESIVQGIYLRQRMR